MKTKPFNHQLKEYEDHKDDEIRGEFWEQGTGKTKVIIDTLAYLYRKGEVDALCVIAPNGVHRNWVSDEIPAHLDDDLLKKTRCYIHYSSDAKYRKKQYEDTLKNKGLAVFVISYNAIITPRGQKRWKEFLSKRKCLYVLDESQRVKTPNCKWSRRILGSKRVSKYRRILSGTPVANSPFDIYNQLRFLDPDVWKKYEITSLQEFQQYFALWITCQLKEKKGTFEKVHCYRNLEKLKEEMNRLGSRVTKDEVLDLPPKLFSKRYFELTPRQKKLYQQMKEELFIELEEGGGRLTGALPIVRLLRFQQICCGYVPASDEDPTLVQIDDVNPRIALLGEVCEDTHHKGIIWARFTKDIDMIMDLMRKKKYSAVKVNGSVTGPARGEALDAFQKGDVQWLVANQQAISTGVTLHAARTVIYYSNTFSLEMRLQTEDRAHRIGLLHPVHYIDLLSDGPVDQRIVDSLRNKMDIACQVTGDSIKDWI